MRENLRDQAVKIKRASIIFATVVVVVGIIAWKHADSRTRPVDRAIASVKNSAVNARASNEDILPSIPKKPSATELAKEVDVGDLSSDGRQNDGTIGQSLPKIGEVSTLESDKEEIAGDKAALKDVIPGRGENVPEHLQAKSARLSRKAGEALELLRKAIFERELQRCQFDSVKEFGNFQYARVVISKPSAFEIREFEQMMMRTAHDVPEDARPYYLVDGQRMLDRYLHFTHPYIVLIVEMNANRVVMTELGNGARAVRPSRGVYWDYYTSNPAQYRVSDELSPDGYRIITPEGIPAYASTPWFSESGQQPVRYRHLFSQLK